MATVYDMTTGDMLYIEPTDQVSAADIAEPEPLLALQPVEIERRPRKPAHPALLASDLDTWFR